MSETFTDKIVKIRKPHQCFSCFRKFEPGTEMRYWCGIYDGDFGSVYSCKACNEIMDRCEPDDDGYPEGFVAYMLEKDQTPEQLLEKMKKDIL